MYELKFSVTEKVKTNQMRIPADKQTLPHTYHHMNIGSNSFRVRHKQIDFGWL